jgi:ketosteroid isomerase-like protein
LLNTDKIVADDHIELARHFLDVYNAGDVDTYVDMFTDDVEAQTDPRFPEGGTFSGREPVRRFFAGLHEGWQGGGAVTVKEARRAGDSVLVSVAWHATGELSGIDVSSDWCVLFTIRDGQIARVRFFSDRAEALAVAGLRD